MFDAEERRTGDARDRLLPWNRVRDIAGISRTTAWRLQQSGEFPTPVRISAHRVGWWESELTAWKARRTARGGEPPKALKAPRAPKLFRTAKRDRQILPERPAAIPPAQDPPVRRPRRRPSVSPDQIDFGFQGCRDRRRSCDQVCWRQIQEGCRHPQAPATRGSPKT